MYDIIIIGGGFAGLSAGVTAGKRRLKTLLLNKAGGHYVSGFPGLDASTIKKEALSLQVEFKEAGATSCSFADGKKAVTTNEPATYEARCVILASGNAPQQSSHPYAGELQLSGRGVSHDVESDGSLCRHSSVAIFGKNAATAESVLKLSKFAEKIFWIIPASKLDFPNDLSSKLDALKGLEPFFSASLKSINGTNEVSSITILHAGQEKHLNVKYVFLPPLQYRPAVEYLSGGIVQTSDNGDILVDQQLQTSIAGVFAAGNVLCHKPQLALICAAQGTIAALNAEKYLENL